MNPLLTFTLAAWAGLELVVLLKRNRSAVRWDWTSLVLPLCLGAGVGLSRKAAEITRFAFHGSPTLVLVAALILMWSGIILRACSIRKLGRFFTPNVMTQAGQTVVDDGPYRFIRHPSYTGALIAILGASLSMRNWLSVLALAALSAIGFAVRIGYEETLLARDLGQPYRQYMERTRRLIPFIY